MTNVKIEKPGAGVFMVRINAANRGAAEKELKDFIAGRPYTKYIDHFNPNSQVIVIHESLPS